MARGLAEVRGWREPTAQLEAARAVVEDALSRIPIAGCGALLSHFHRHGANSVAAERRLGCEHGQGESRQQLALWRTSGTPVEYAEGIQTSTSYEPG